MTDYKQIIQNIKFNAYQKNLKNHMCNFQIIEINTEVKMYQ